MAMSHKKTKASSEAAEVWFYLCQCVFSACVCIVKWLMCLLLCRQKKKSHAIFRSTVWSLWESKKKTKSTLNIWLGIASCSFSPSASRDEQKMKWFITGETASGEWDKMRWDESVSAVILYLTEKHTKLRLIVAARNQYCVNAGREVNLAAVWCCVCSVSVFKIFLLSWHWPLLSAA